MADLNSIYGIVHAVMTGLVFFGLAVMACVACCTARRLGDAARSGLIWLKATMAIVALDYLFTFVSDALYVARNLSRSLSSGSLRGRALYEATLRISILGTFLERIGDILLLITFVELANGFMFLLDQKKAMYQKILLFAAFGVGFILFALNLGYFGYINALYSPYITYLSFGGDLDFDFDAFDNGLRICRQLAAAFEILCWIVSLPIMGYAAFVVHSHRMNTFTRPSAVLLLVASILSLGRYTYFLAYHATYGLTEEFPPAYIPVTDGIFNVWFLFVVLMLLYAIGASKHRGLLSGPQSGRMAAPMAGPPGQMPVYGYPQQQYGMQHQPTMGHQPMMQQQPMYTGTAYAHQQPTLPIQQPGGHYQQPMQQPMPTAGYHPVQQPGQMPMYSYGPQPMQQQVSPPHTAATSASPPPHIHSPAPASSSSPAPELQANGNETRPPAEVKA